MLKINWGGKDGGMVTRMLSHVLALEEPYSIGLKTRFVLFFFVTFFKAEKPDS